MQALSPLVKNNVTIAGNPQASQTLVFVHGFGTDQSAWKDVAAAFSQDYRLVLLDNVGANGTAPGNQLQYLDLHGYAQDVVAIAAELQLRDAVLVGHSVGGMISLLSAVRKPEHFSRLVMICASPRYLNDEGYKGGFTKPDLDGLYSALMSHYSEWADGFAPMVMGNEDRPQLAENFAQALKRIPKETALTVLYSIFQSDHRADLPKLNKPTLLIQSPQDVAVPLEVAHYLNQHIKDSTLWVINASGHFPHLSAPDEVIRAMQAFLPSPAQQPPPRTA